MIQNFLACLYLKVKGLIKHNYSPGCIVYAKQVYKIKTTFKWIWYIIAYNNMSFTFYFMPEQESALKFDKS